MGLFPATPRLFPLSDCAPADRLPVDYQPGDLIFFAGHDRLSRAIALRTCTWRQIFRRQWFSHVGIVADWPDAGRTLLVESTTLCDLPCIVAGRLVSGVQAHLPSTRVGTYPGRVWRLRLRRPLAGWESKQLTQFCRDTLGQPYNLARAVWLSTHFTRQLFLSQTDPLPDSWFCSDHAMAALKTVDRVGQDHDPEEFSPGQLAHLVLHSGAYWPIGKIGTKSFLVKG